MRDPKSTGRLVLMALCAASLLSVAACNTIGGVGKDTSAAGSAVTNTADKVKDKM